MKNSRNVLAGTAIVLATICVLIFLLTRTQEKQIEISYADLQASIDRELSRSNEVGFIIRVRFNNLSVRFDEGVIFEGTGNWMNLGVGGYVLPNVTVAAGLPTEISAWSVSKGVINVNHVQIITAFREPSGTSDGRPESDANREGWQKKLTKYLQRLDVFRDEDLVSGDWRVVSVQSRADSLVISLEN